MFAILRARSMADSEGLQTIGVLGSRADDPTFVLEKCPIMSKIPKLAFEGQEGSIDPRKSISSSSSSEALLL